MVMAVAYGSLTTDSEPQVPATLVGEMPVPSVKVKSLSGSQADCMSCSWAGLINSPVSYSVSGPRSRRLSWMLLRSLLALMSV